MNHIDPHALTPQELRIFHALARGLNTCEVGEALGVASSTVKTHTERGRRKLHARNTVHAVALCYEMGAWAPNWPNGGTG